jgi:CRISPR-associated protein NE0113 (Cas_NE0113)
VLLPDQTTGQAAYQKKLEETIRRLQTTQSDCQILLALMGGRKGMAALAMFAAQNTGIHAVYHTLIADARLNEEVLDETDLNELSKLQAEKRHSLLFLDAYASQREQFVAFPIPIIPPQGQNAR